jgi:hypothetical protein
MKTTSVLTNGDRYYKVEESPVFITQLNSADPTDILTTQKPFEMPSLITFIQNGYHFVNKGGKKSRNNRKHKKNGKTKRRGGVY